MFLTSSARMLLLIMRRRRRHRWPKRALQIYKCWVGVLGVVHKGCFLFATKAAVQEGIFRGACFGPRSSICGQFCPLLSPNHPPTTRPPLVGLTTYFEVADVQRCCCGYCYCTRFNHIHCQNTHSHTHDWFVY